MLHLLLKNLKNLNFLMNHLNLMFHLFLMNLNFLIHRLSLKNLNYLKNHLNLMFLKYR
jgi:hypothetical protein